MRATRVRMVQTVTISWPSSSVCAHLDGLAFFVKLVKSVTKQKYFISKTYVHYFHEQETVQAYDDN